MSTLFIEPKSFTVVNSNSATLNPASNLNLDYPSYVWRSANLTTVYLIVDIGAGASYDTVALIGCNLRGTDTIRVRTGSTNTGVGSFDTGADAPFEGYKSSAVTTKAIALLGETRTERYIRIDITATSHPDTYVEAQRLVVGSAIETAGMDADAEFQIEDRSVITSYSGGETVDEYDGVPSWKFAIRWIPAETWNAQLRPFLGRVKTARSFLFIPNDETPETWQHDAVFGRFKSNAQAKHVSYEEWTIEATVTGLAP